MSTTMRDHRLSYLICRLKGATAYPSKEELLEGLKSIGLEVSSRTLDRDFEQLNHAYGIAVAYDRQYQGYCIRYPEDEDIADFDTFLSLLARKERLRFLDNSAQDLFRASRFLVLDHQPDFPGTDQLPLLWEALQHSIVVTFDYRTYQGSLPSPKRVEPSLLVEDHHRWYLVGKGQKSQELRVYGIDRIENVTLTGETFVDHVREQYKARKRHAIGMHIYEQEPIKVMLRVSREEVPYVLSAPLHESQQVMNETKEYVDIQLEVVHNIELERAILAYGEAIEVLGPDSLRRELAARIRKMHQRYG